MSIELQGLYDITPNKLVPLDHTFPYVWVFGDVSFVQSEGLYTSSPGISAMVLYSDSMVQEPVQLTDGKTIEIGEVGLEFQNVRGPAPSMFLKIEQQTQPPFEVSFEIQNVSFFKNLNKVQNVSQSSSTIVFDTVPNRDHDHTLLLDYSTNDPECGKVQVGNVHVSLPETDMQRKQFTIEVHESHMDTRFSEETNVNRISTRFPTTGEPIRLTATRNNLWSRFLFWNMEFYHGIQIQENIENSIGAHNLFIGNNSGTQEGEHNVCVGHGAGVSGRDNVLLGNNNTGYIGNNNVFLGNNTGCNGSNNILISSKNNETQEINNSIQIGSLVSGNMETKELVVHGTLATDAFDTEAFVANTGNFETNLTASQANIDYFTSNVGNVNYMTANVANVNYLNTNVKVSAPEFTDGNLSIMNGDITGVNTFELNGALMYCENGKIKFQYEGKTFVLMTENS